jgi:hypothetical protein
MVNTSEALLSTVYGSFTWHSLVKGGQRSSRGPVNTACFDTSIFLLELVLDRIVSYIRVTNPQSITLNRELKIVNFQRSDL